MLVVKLNTNPNAKRILCFGDSNTWGYISGSDHKRLPINQRWTGILQDQLGENYEVIEEGLNSRTISSKDKRPGKNGRDSMNYILPCLDSHDPIDLVILFVGTGELKFEFDKSAEEVFEEILNLKTIVETRKSQFRNTFPKVLVLSPPSINENTQYTSKNNKYKGADEKSQILENILRSAINENEFLATREITKVGPDGVHLDEESHKSLAQKLAKKVKLLVSS